MEGRRIFWPAAFSKATHDVLTKFVPEVVRDKGVPKGDATHDDALFPTLAQGEHPMTMRSLIGVLAMAATSDTIMRGVFLLGIYSAGLAIPFLLTALGINQFLHFYQKFRRYLHAVEVSSGALLLGVGGLIFFNRLTWLSGKLTFLNRFVK